MFDYGRVRATWEYAGDDYHETIARAPGIDVELRLTTDLNIGLEGPRATARHLMKAGEPAVLRALLERASRPAHHRGGQRAADLDGAPLAALARPGRVPRPPLALGPAAQRADPQGPDLRPHRCDRRRADDLAARDARRRAQLGLPLRLDPRRHVRALGPLHARLRLGGERLLLLRRRRDGGRGGPPPDHVRDRRPGRPARAHARAPVRLRERPPGARGQRRPRPAPARRVGRGARLPLPPHALARPPARALLADAVHAGGERGGELARPGLRHLGGAGASRSTSPPPSSCAGWRWTAAPAWPSCARTGIARRAGAPWPTRSTPTSARNAIDHRGAFTQHYDTTALDASVLLMPLLRFLPPTDPRIRTTVLAVADELTEDGLVLRYRVEETDDGLAGRGGHVHHLLLLARVRAVRDRGDGPRARPVREAARLLQRPRAVRRGDRHDARGATSATSRRPSRTWR